MRELSNWQLWIYRAGGIVLLVGAVLWMTRLPFAPYVYSVGALGFSSMQILASYDGRSVVIRRLRRQQILGALFLLLAGVLMFTDMLHMGFLQHHEWMVCLMIAAIFEVYTAYRIPAELRKEQK